MTPQPRGVAHSDAEAPHAPFYVDGLSIVLFDFYVLKSDGVDSPRMGASKVVCSHDYRLVLGASRDDWKAPDTYEVDDRLQVGRIDLPLAGMVSGEARLFVCRLSPTMIAATTVVNFAVAYRTFCPVYIKTNQLQVDDVIHAIHHLSSSDSSIFRHLDEQRRTFISKIYGQLEDQPQSSTHRSLVGVQVWETGSGTLPARELVKEYAWEVAAILTCTDDRVRTAGAWRKITEDEVLNATANVRSSTGAYAVLTSGPICIELFDYDTLTTQLTPELLERTTERLRLFGYDSTSIYLWGRLAAISCISSHYDSVLSTTLEQVTELLDELPRNPTGEGHNQNRSISALAQIVRLKVEVNRTLDDAYWRFTMLPEERRTQFFNEGLQKLRLGHGVKEVDRKMDILSSAFNDISRTLGAVDESRTLKEIRDLGRATEWTTRVVLLLNILVAASFAIEFSAFISMLSDDGIDLIGQGITASATFAVVIMAVILYYFSAKHR